MVIDSAGVGNQISAGTQLAGNGSTVVFSNSNGITFGLSNSSILTAQHNGLTSQSNQAFSAAGGSSAFQTLSFNNANGATFSNNAGAVELSYTVPSTAGLLSNIRVSAGTTSNLLSAVTFSNANGVSFGIDSSTITASHNGLTTAAASDHSHGNPQLNLTNLSGTTASNSAGFTLSLSAAAAGGGGETRLTAYATSNTTQSSTGTIALSSLIFAGAGIASVGVSNGSVVVSVPSGGGAGDGGVFAGVSNLGNTAGSTGTVSTGNFVLVGSNGISLSQSTGAAGSAATVTILGDNPVSFWEPPWGHAGQSGFFGGNASQWPGNGSVQVFPIQVSAHAVLSKALGSVSLSISSSSNSSHGGTLSWGVGIYSRNVNTLSLISSAIGTYAWTNTSNNSTASLSGMRQVSAAFGGEMTLVPGDYWMGVWSRTSTVNANWFTASNLIIMTSGSNSTHSGNFMSAAAAASFHPGIPGNGTFSATSDALPASMAFSNITGTARWWYRPRIAMRNFD